jgi:hypothetical protein
VQKYCQGLIEKLGNTMPDFRQTVIGALVGASATAIIGTAGSAISNGWLIQQMGGVTQEQLEAFKVQKSEKGERGLKGEMSVVI